MSPLAIFALQLVWFLIAWSVLAAVFIAPWLRSKSAEEGLAFCTAAQLFRVLGLGLLVPQLSPGLPESFAVHTAVGDSLTALLALLALLALRRSWRHARAAVWACHVVGALDLAIALPHAATIGAAQFLAAQWYVPALGVPLMIVSHVMALRILLRRTSR